MTIYFDIYYNHNTMRFSRIEQLEEYVCKTWNVQRFMIKYKESSSYTSVDLTDKKGQTFARIGHYVIRD